MGLTIPSNIMKLSELVIYLHLDKIFNDNFFELVVTCEL